ncbi:MAG: LuxR C-terminal-related transcriptional regulator [Cytophagaceae bacterium]|nr:LuxR C-terminal-related transcriptional regulator [Cytophagaceae bacterium]
MIDRWWEYAPPLIHHSPAEIMQPTPRETDVLRLIAEEVSSQEIARRLGIALPTVETHRRNLFRKAGVKSAVGLVLVALKEGWV